MTPGPDESVLMAYVAERHYIQRKTRIQLAEELGLSRFKVARLLEQAVEHGIVRFHIDAPNSIDLELSMALRTTYDLERALVVMCPDGTPSGIQESLGRVAAELLEEIVEEGELLGVTAGRTVGAMSRQISKLPRCDITQLAGVAGSIREDGIEITRRLRNASGGHANALVAPLLLPDGPTRSGLARDPHIRKAVSSFPRVTKAVVAIGSWRPPDSQLHESAALMGELDRMLELGVQTEICGTLLRADGSVVEEYSERMLAISTAQLMQVPMVLAVAGGITKTVSIASGLKSGIVTSLVTDSETARRLLDLTERDQPGSRT